MLRVFSVLCFLFRFDDTPPRPSLLPPHPLRRLLHPTRYAHPHTLLTPSTSYHHHSLTRSISTYGPRLYLSLYLGHFGSVVEHPVVLLIHLLV